MKKKLLLIITLCIVASSYAQDTFKKEEILKNLMLANAYFMDKWPDTGKTIITNKIFHKVINQFLKFSV